MTVSEFHKQLEKASKNLNTNLEVPPIIKSIVGDASKANTGIVKAANYELDFFNLNILKNQLKPSFVYTDKEGNPVNDPDVFKFDEDQWDYLKKRASNVQTDLLKIHYNHILWHSPKKNIDCAKIAIMTYPNLIARYKDMELIDPGKANWRLLVNAVANNLLLSNSIKWRNVEAKSVLIDLVFTYDLLAKSSGGVLKNLIELMLEERNVFKKEDFYNVSQRLDDLRKIVGKEDLHFATEIIDLIIKVEIRLSNDQTNWYDLQGETWEELTKQRKNGSFVTTDFCRTAISFYMKSGNLKKIAELRKLYGRLRKEVSLDFVQSDIDVTKLNKEIKKLTNSILTVSVRPSPCFKIRNFI